MHANYALSNVDEGDDDRSGEDSHESQSNCDLDTARDFLNGLLDCDDCGDKVLKAVSRIQSKIAEEKTLLCDHRTAQLWLQYMDGGSLRANKHSGCCQCQVVQRSILLCRHYQASHMLQVSSTRM